MLCVAPAWHHADEKCPQSRLYQRFVATATTCLTCMGSQVRVLYRAPSKNLGITMVPRFFLCLFLEEKSLSACGILGYFRAISGLLVAKVLQIFSALYPLCHKGLRDFCGYHCCKFLKPTPSEMLHALSRWFVFPCFDDHNACKHARSYPQYCGQQDTAPL